MIVDEVTITVEAGSGGNGCLSFRREKFVPYGGPDGGNGGRGGNIFMEARTDVGTLVDFIYKPIYEAKHGVHGKGKNMYGKATEDVIIRVPVGTMVYDANHELIVDLNQKDMKVLVAKGGRGGRGNTTFTTATQQAPKIAERGEPGEKILRLELKLLADVGLVGFPNAGKSTLLSRVTHATPKIADYPFTTLEPQLGVVRISEGRSFVMADIPGLIEGASQGKGLGIKFLKHLERTKILLHLVELATLTSFADLEKRIKIIKNELKQHSLKFLEMPQIVVLTKADSSATSDYPKWVKKLEKKGVETMVISAVTGLGLKPLIEKVWAMLTEIKEKELSQPVILEEKLYQAKVRFKVEKHEGFYRVSGPEIKKWVAMTNFENHDATERFYRILNRMGVIKELKKLDVHEGDKIVCEDLELTFEKKN